MSPTSSSNKHPNSNSSTNNPPFNDVNDPSKNLNQSSPTRLLSHPIDLPQSSERDSISATTYSQSTSPPPISSHGLSDVDDPIGQTIIVPVLSPTTTTTTTTTTIKPSQTFQSESYHFSLGTKKTDQFGLPETSPVELSVSPTQIYPLGPDKEDEEKEERLRYRFWREGKSESKMANRSESDDIHKMSRHIQATLPKGEGHVISSRSRKSSQYLGLFKEQDLDDVNDNPKKSHKKFVDQALSPIVSPSILPNLDAEDQQSDDQEDQERYGVYEALSHGGPQNKHTSKSSSTISSSHSHPDLKSITTNYPSIDQSLQSTRPNTRDGNDIESSLSNFQLPPPANHFVESIESNYTGKGKQKQSISPIFKYTENIQDIKDIDDNDDGNDSGNVDIKDDSDSSNGSGNGNDNDNENSNDNDDEDDTNNDEESDQEQEHISSALYYPHRQIRPDMSPELEGAIRPPLARTQSEKITQEQVVSEQIEEELTMQSTSPEEVEISLQTGDHNQTWKADYAITSEPESNDNFMSDVESSLSDFESHDGSLGSDAGITSDDELITDNLVTPRQQQQRFPSKINKRETGNILGAVQLKPFNHQVGGHSTVYQFSRRAVCKQLNNRENVFYETVEKKHPELLEFMPRYIGVVNVTYTRAPKRKKTRSSTMTQEMSHDSCQELQQDSNSNSNSNSYSNLNLNKASKTIPSHKQTQTEDVRRIVSHSQQSQQSNGAPQVIFENNRHIIPEKLLRGPIGAIRPATPEPREKSLIERRSLSKPLNPIESVSREASPRPIIKQWGSTYVNRKLQEQVLKEVFTPPIIHRHHRHQNRRHHNLSTSDVISDNNNHRTLSQSTPSSYRSLNIPYEIQQSEDDQLNKSRSFDQSSNENSHAIGIPLYLSRTEPDENLDEVIIENLRNEKTNTIKRSHSGSGLIRKSLSPLNFQRGNLEYHETEQDSNEYNEVFAFDDIKNPSKDDSLQIQKHQNITKPKLQPAIDLTMTPIGPKNPVQARFQADERNEMFILLEDLTSRMRHPCVLDLKMGTRQYGIEADEKKQKSQQRKCQTTTSRQLGVRVCGMQVWNIRTQSYLFEDKYFGRDLKAGGEFQNALKRFFFDGISHNTGLKFIPVILEKLLRMERMIKNLPGYRFYASSLLIIYDRGGDDLISPIPPSISKESDRQSDIKSTLKPPLNSLIRADSAPPIKLKPKNIKSSPLKLKIVDFANCVVSEDTIRLEKANLPPAHPNDIDRGYLRGLRSLRVYFQRVWKELGDEEWVERGDTEDEGISLNQRGLGKNFGSAEGEISEDGGYISI